MLEDLLTSFTEKYHETGHIDPPIDQMMDMGGGFGHRVEFGHGIDGFLRAYNMEGMQGMHSWMDHILKDFTSPAGIPLPFAGAFVHLTPLDLNDGVTWLSVNAADFMELGAEVIAIEVIERRFSDNKNAYHIALASGLALGFVDDNPLLIAFSGAKWMLNAKKNLAVINPEMNSKIDISMSRGIRGVEIASYWALGCDAAAHLFHFADIMPYLEHASHGVPIFSSAVDIGDGLVNIADGMATFGAALAMRKAVKLSFELLNGVKKRDADRLADKVMPKVLLVDLLQSGAPPTALVGTLTQMKAIPVPSGGN